MTRQIRLNRYASLIILLVLFSGTLLLQATAQTGEAYYPIDGWKEVSPSAYAMNTSRLDDMVEYIEDNHISINSIVVIHNGTLVFEQYFDFFDENQTANIFSCTKSFTSTAMGLAIDKGYIANTSLKIVDLFPDRTIANLDSRKEAITIEDLLTMRVGMDWDDNSASGMSEYNNMLRADDWVQYVLDRPMMAEPGSRWNYNSGASLLLSAIVQNATGMTADEFTAEHLFGPLGISDYTWRENAQGISIGGNTITLRARDMARFGYLFLRNGYWAGEQIISSDWVQAASTSYSVLGAQGGYGYQWWIRHDINSFYAAGYAGQFIHVLPDYDAVVVFQATSGVAFDPLTEWIIPALTEDPYLNPEPFPGELIDSVLIIITGSIITIAAIGIVFLSNRK